ncbi:hypothetical protein SISSUDRAFT_1041514 [Sistotremastrum suecicum HHB10207 ss-3]|uniref:Uncharacterized protein n=1 Tax=Sistotremastrum suecicum HHB10207 ss-3 TaxID=1314776 RepID=A0A166HBN1_9AGAM|nr:hypothetical protein SISSUDRAFT_1041514 [Sistotremastrum suecicum HHB10207 ss-3]
MCEIALVLEPSQGNHRIGLAAAKLLSIIIFVVFGGAIEIPQVPRTAPDHILALNKSQILKMMGHSLAPSLPHHNVLALPP